MKNVTVSLDDATYRNARLRAAEMDKSLSAVVREYLTDFGARESEFKRLERLELEMREQLRERRFSASDRQSREEMYDEACGIPQPEATRA